MSADLLGAFLIMLMAWRVLLCALVFGVAALLLVSVLPWFSGWQGAVLAVLGTATGLVWETSLPHEGSAPAVKTPVSVACLAAFLGGGLWGAASSSSPESFMMGCVCLGGLVWIWVHLAKRSAAGEERDRGLLSSLAATLGFLVGALSVAIAL